MRPTVRSPLASRLVGVVTALIVLPATACVGDTASDASLAAGEPETWALGAEPVLDIGVVEGEEPYQLHSATSSRKLPDGRIAVVNGGSSEVRLYGPDGVFQHGFGSDGDGPGEFRRATRLTVLPDRRLRIWDQRLHRFSDHTVDGTHLGVERLQVDSSVEPFPLDVWYYERHLIDSPIPPASRGVVAAALERLPAVDSLIPARYAWVTEQGRIWTSDVELPADAPVELSIWSLNGDLVARLTVPSRFEPHDIGPDYVLGRAFDELDVNYIREYTLSKPEGSDTGPGLDELRMIADKPVDYSVGEVSEEVGPTIKSMLKNLASRQEINYSTEMSYTNDLVALELEVPQGIRVEFIQATPRGWTGIITHLPTGAFCALSYGFTVPMGWQGGAVVCPGL